MLSLIVWALLHNMEHNKVLHERNVLMNVRTEDVPSLPETERLEIHHFGQNFHTVTIRYGFLEEPDIPRALALDATEFFRIPVNRIVELGGQIEL